MAKAKTSAQEIRNLIIDTLEQQELRGRMYIQPNGSVHQCVISRINAIFAKHQESFSVCGANLFLRGIDESKQLVLEFTTTIGKKPLGIVIK